MRIILARIPAGIRHAGDRILAVVLTPMEAILLGDQPLEFLLGEHDRAEPPAVRVEEFDIVGSYLHHIPLREHPTALASRHNSEYGITNCDHF